MYVVFHYENITITIDLGKGLSTSLGDGFYKLFIYLQRIVHCSKVDPMRVCLLLI